MIFVQIINIGGKWKCRQSKWDFFQYFLQTYLVRNYHVFYYILTSNKYANQNNIEYRGILICFWLLSGEYLQNRCPPNVKDCAPCEQRLPRCIGLPDGNNAFPGRPFSEYYIKCFRNRTVSVEACQVSLYDQTLRTCSPTIDQGTLSFLLTEINFYLKYSLSQNICSKSVE